MHDVIVLGRNYATSLGAVRSLGRAGYNVELIYNSFRRDGAVASKSKYLKKYKEVLDYTDEKYIDAILESAGAEKKVLFPTDDLSAELIDSYRNILSEHFLLPGTRRVNLEEQVSFLMRKDVQLKLAAEAGLSVPKSLTVDITKDQVEIPDDIQYPCFTKPLHSADGGKDEIGRCSSKEELLSKIEFLKKNKRKAILVQELLDIENEIVINGVCNDSQVVIPAIIKKTMIAKHSKGVTVSGIVTDTKELPKQLEEKLRVFLKSLRYVGIFDLELMVTKDRIYFGEINLRVGGPHYSYTLCGANLPELAVAAIAGEQIPDTVQISLGKSFVNDRVLWDDYLLKEITRNEFKRCMDSAEYSLLYDLDDPVPSKRFRRRMVKTLIRKRIGACVKGFVRTIRKK